MDDGDLIRLFTENQTSAFEELVRKYQDRIYNLCRYMIRDPWNAQDAAQDTFVKAFKGLKGLDSGSSPYTWLYRIAVNTCLDYRRKTGREARQSGPLSEDLPSAGPRPDSIYESKEKGLALRAALSKLPGKMRAPIVLREIEGLSYEEIAQVLRISTGTVKSRLSRAREELRRQLTRNIPNQ